VFNHDSKQEFFAHQLKPLVSASFFDQPRNTGGIKVDWHNYRLMANDKNRVGVGEHGKAGKISGRKKVLEQNIFKQNGYNGLLSDLISVNRSLPDIRHKE
jgi:polypeptide N-acetylgalactosaminyltransferase